MSTSSSFRSTNIPSNTNPSFSEDRWVIQIRRTLEEDLEEEHSNIPVRIFAVPKTLLATDPNSYTPQQVAIGPYHYWRPELYEMERYKIAAAKRILKVINGFDSFRGIVDEFKEGEPRIRACYHKYLDFSGETLAWMMAIDASFLLEFLEVYASKEGKLLTRISSRMSHLVDSAGRKSAHIAILRDILMLENQIPLFLLREMLKFHSEMKEVADDMLLSMLKGLCKELFPFRLPEELPKLLLQDSAHILDFFYRLLMPKAVYIAACEFTEDDDQGQGMGDDQENITSDKSSGVVKTFFDEIWKILSKLNDGPSVVFTAAPLFLIAAVWFLGFGLSLLLLCICFCCFRRRPSGYSQTAYALSLIFLTLFTFATIAGAVVLYTGQEKFHKSTIGTLDYVVKQANKTVDNLMNVSDYLASAKQTGVDQVFLPPDVQGNIDNVQIKINSSAISLEQETEKNSRRIRKVLDAVGLALIIIATVMLFVAFLGFVFSIFGLQSLVYLMVIIGWILVTLAFILCGLFLAVHNVMGDSCVAMDQWVQNPTAHSALDEILPCVDPATAQDILSQSKDVTYQLVVVVNRIIINVSNVNIPPGVHPVGPFFYNQSGPLVPVLCNPYNPDKTDRNCLVGELQFSNATQVWKNYECQVSGGNCTTVGRLTPNMYSQMVAAVNVSIGLCHYGPFLAGLLNCTSVRDTFTGIHNEHCPDLRLYSKWVYIGLALVSAAVMFSLILWLLYARERCHRKYTRFIKAPSAPNSVELKEGGLK